MHFGERSILLGFLGSLFALLAFCLPAPTHPTTPLTNSTPLRQPATTPTNEADALRKRMFALWRN